MCVCVCVVCVCVCSDICVKLLYADCMLSESKEERGAFWREVLLTSLLYCREVGCWKHVYSEERLFIWIQIEWAEIIWKCINVVHRRRQTVLEIHILCLNWAAVYGWEQSVLWAAVCGWEQSVLWTAVCGWEQSALWTADVRLHYTTRFGSSLRGSTVRCH